MEQFSTSYFGYPTYEQYRQKRFDELSSAAGYIKDHNALLDKDGYDAEILADIDRHCEIVISEVKFCQGATFLVKRQWRWENPVIFDRLPADIQKWIRTKTTAMQPVYG